MSEVKRDHYGRYLLPHPETGIEQSWTRATTIANTLSDRYALEQWAQRNTVRGIGLRPDLYALASSSTADDKSQLNSIVKQAQEAAHASSSANLGTALHRLTERIDKGELLDVADEWRADVDAYLAAFADNGIKVESIEQIVVRPDLGVAGTFDRIVSLNGSLYVADLKTGANTIQYGMGEVAIQLALYAGASHVWTDLAGAPDNAYDPMPAVSQDTALVIHLPVGTGVCTLHWVDLEAGREGIEIAMAVRDWRNRSSFTVQLNHPQLTVVPTDDW